MKDALRRLTSANYTVIQPFQQFVGEADGIIALSDCYIPSINGNLTNTSLHSSFKKGEKHITNITELTVGNGYALLINPKGNYNVIPLLDIYPATAAYSLRKLSDTYTGDAIRVRRDSDNAEQDIGFVNGELDTAALESFVKSETTTLPADFGSGAAAAYSLRYVTNSYSGAVIRVREDGLNAEQDFTPSEITDGTLASFCGANNGFVATWYDQSGNSNDATQVTAGNQPKVVDAGVLVTENGKAAIKFDGTDDFLSNTFSSSISQPTYWFVTHNFHAIPSAFDGVIGGLSTTPEHRLLLNSSLNYTLQSGGSLAYNGYQTNQSLIAYKIHNIDPRFYFNGTEQSISAGTAIGTSALGSIVIGSFSETSGHTPIQFQEIILYNSDQSANRTEIEYAINDYYNIYTPTANGFVTTWYDQSGNANHATQATAAAQPQIVSGGSVILENGKAAVYFPNRLASLDLTSLVSVNTFFAVNKVDSAGLFNYILFRQSPVNGFYVTKAGDIYGLFDGSQRNATTVNSYNQNLDYYNYNTNYKIGVNGGVVEELLTATTQLSIDTISRTEPLADLSLNGNLQEIIIYPSDQSSNRTAIEDSINDYYNIY